MLLFWKAGAAVQKKAAPVGNLGTEQTGKQTQFIVIGFLSAAVAASM